MMPFRFFLIFTVYLILIVLFLHGSAQKVKVNNEVDSFSDYDDEYTDTYIEQIESTESFNRDPSSFEDKKYSKTIFEEMFGEKLYMWVKDDITGGAPSIFPAATKEILKKKMVVGVYFSASWCPPCRQFTPLLVKLYNAINKRRPGAFEIVWVSGDRTQEDFVSYFEKMPWLAVTLEQIQSVTQTLSPRFKVRGIPHLVLLDGEDGSIISMDAKSLVADDPSGVKFPWKSPHSRLIKLLLPNSVRTYIKKQINSLKAKAFLMIKDALRKLSPLQWFSKPKKETSRRR